MACSRKNADSDADQTTKPLSASFASSEEDKSNMPNEGLPLVTSVSNSTPDGTESGSVVRQESSSGGDKGSSSTAHKRRRTCKCNCSIKHLFGSPHETSAERRTSQRLQIKNYKLPFPDLPRECKIHVFFYLSIFERGIAAQVCREWQDLIQLPGVWSFIDLSVFNIMHQKSPGSRHHGRACTDCKNYQTYVKRVSLFLKFVAGVHPALKRLSLSLDFGNRTENWKELVLDLMAASRCTELGHVNLDWCHVPQKPLCYDNFCCRFNKGRSLCQLHTQRLVVFHDFFKQFSKLTTGVRQLTIPFPWTWRNVRYLCRFQHLEQVTLEKYLLLRSPEQKMLDVVLAHLPNLEMLKLVICMPFYGHKRTFSISHPRLQVLDISECQGFFLNQLNLPSLRVIRVSRKHWQGALLSPNIIPCITNLLLDGALNVTHINKFRLDVYWKEYEYPEMKSHLETVCPCFRHAIRWQ